MIQSPCQSCPLSCRDKNHWACKHCKARKLYIDAIEHDADYTGLFVDDINSKIKAWIPTPAEIAAAALKQKLTAATYPPKKHKSKIQRPAE